MSCTSSIGTLGYMARGFCYPVVNGGSDKELRIEFPNHLKVCGLFYVFFATKNYPKMAMASVKMLPIMVIVLVFKVNIPPKVPAD